MAKATCSIDGCPKPAKGRGWCGMHYDRWRHHGDPLVTKSSPPNQPATDRIKARSVVGSGGCWVWQGGVNSRGYAIGKMTGYRTGRVARVAYQEWVGPIPEGYEVDHLCHTDDPSCMAGNDCPHRRCVNPLHLEAVPSSENKRRKRPHPQPLKEACKWGHPFDAENTYYRLDTGARMCKRCMYLRNRRRRLGRATN